MNRWNRKADTLILLKFFLPFFLIMFLSLVVGYIIYQRTSTVLENEVRKANSVLLEKSMNVLDNRLQSLDGVIRKMAEDSKVQALQQVKDPFDREHLYQTIEVKDRFQDYSIGNELVLDFFVLYRNGLVINNDFISRLSSFPETLKYTPRDDDDLSRLLEGYYYRETLPANRIILGERAHSVLTYLHSFGYPGFSNGLVLFLLQEEEIQSLLRGLNIEDGWAYIADADGTLLTGVTGTGGTPSIRTLNLPSSEGVLNETIEGKEMIITYVTSAYNGWTYVAAQPSEVVLDKIIYIKETTFTIFFLFLFAAAVIAVYFANRNRKPVQALLQTVSRYAPESVLSGGNPYGRIQNTVSEIIDTNEELREKMDRQMPFLRASFLERLLRGQFAFESDMDAVMRSLKIEWAERSAFLVAIITFPSDSSEGATSEVERLNERKIVIRERLMRELSDGSFVHEVDSDKLALILYFGSAQEELAFDEAQRTLASIQDGLQREHGIGTVISVGGLCSKPSDISRSFLEAQQALVRSRDTSILWYRNSQPQRSGYMYPENVETRLLHLVRAGKEEELAHLLEELYQENFVNRDLPVFILKVFIYDFIGSLIKLSGDAEDVGLQVLTPSLSALESEQSIRVQFRSVRDQVMAICREAKASMQVRHKQGFEEILRYIDANFSEPQMSLTHLADRFDLSETYLSRCFKEQAGFNFSEYLENKRIEKSRELLAESELPIGDIAIAVGYSSANTFGRAFKRATGLTSMAYRERNQRKNKK